MNCPSCGAEVAADLEFSLCCGAEMKGAATTGSTASDSIATATAVASDKPAAFTLQLQDGRTFPLYEGQTFSLGRPDDPDAKLDLPIPSDEVSSTPLTFKVEGGKLTASYPGAAQKAYSVLKDIKPSEAAAIEKGEMVMAGNVPIVIT